MGMDLYINRLPRRDVECEGEELFYARKFWALLDVPFIRAYNDTKGDGYVNAWIETREDWDELVEIAVSTPNYFGTYDNVPALLEARDRWQEDKENGEKTYYLLHADW